MNRLLVLGGPHIPPTGVRALVAIVEDVELIPAHRRDFTRPLRGEEDQQESVRDQVMTVHRLRIEHADWLDDLRVDHEPLPAFRFPRLRAKYWVEVEGKLTRVVTGVPPP